MPVEKFVDALFFLMAHPELFVSIIAVSALAVVGLAIMLAFRLVGLLAARH
jgi:hypothetical protein